MAIIDDIAAERQRIAERLARVDAERQNLAEQLAEFDAAERVLSRMAPAAPSRRGRRARLAETTATAPGRGSGAGRVGRRVRQKPGVALGDATLQAVGVLGNNASAEQIREYLAEHFGMQVRPNHLGMALQRHRRTGRLQEQEGRWLMTAPTPGPAALL
jgi:hypothetical protein